MTARPLWPLSVALAACASEPATDAPVLASTTIALSADGASLWLTSPDDDRVVQVDPETLVERAFVVVPDAPSHLAIVGDDVLVTSALGRSVHRVRGKRVEALETPCGGTGAVVAHADRAVVACPNDDRLLLVDLAAWRVLAEVPAPGRPSALGVWDGVLLVGGARDGAVRRFEWTDALEPAGIDALGERPGIAAVGIAGLVPDPGGRDCAAVYQRVEHDPDRDRPPERGSYGAVFDDAPRIEPRLRSGCAERYARFDGGPGAFSGPSALAASASHLWIVHGASANVAVLDCHGTVREVRVGAGARGIALADDGRRAWVDVGFDHAIARLEIGEEVPFTRRRDTGPRRLSEAAERGRRLFHDATSPALTPSTVLACATCHPDGGEDGLSWFLHTRHVPRKLRRTPPAWGGRPELAPFHHDGAYDDAARLTRETIVGLMDGTALTVDVEAVAAWLAEIPPPPPRPLDVPGGRGIFERAGCSDCHPGPWLTDGLAHELGLARDPDALRGPVQTPSLRGLRARRPYLHDGSAPDLRTLLRDRDPGDRHGHTSDLTDAELDTLVAWLETL